MLKYKIYLILIIFYNTFSVCMLIFVPSIRHSNSFIYENLYFILFIFMYYFFTVRKKPLDFEYHKHSKKKDYIMDNILKYSLFNLLSVLIILVSNILIAISFQIDMNFHLHFVYSIHLFIIFEIIYVFILSVIYKKKFVLLFSIYYFIFFLLYVLNISVFSESLIPNIFKYYTNSNQYISILIHYLLWGFIGYLLVEKNCERIEI